MYDPTDWQKFDERFGDPWWRQTNLYKIVDTISSHGRKATGRSQIFRPNRVQLDIEKNFARKMIILKARQHGITTYFLIKWLDMVLWNPDTSVCILAHDKDTLEIIFNKIQLAWDSLDSDLKTYMPKPRSDNKYELHWRDGTTQSLNSRIYVALRVVGGTNHVLHISESPKINPSRIAETIPTVPPDGIVIEESTPMTLGDRFHTNWLAAKRGESEYKPLFYEWWWRDDYHQNVKDVTRENLTFEERSLVDNHGLTFEQIQWRRSKWKELQQSDGSNLFLREYPEDDVSCFVSAGDSAFDNQTLEVHKSWIVKNNPAKLRGYLSVHVNPAGHKTVGFVEHDNGPVTVYEPPRAEQEYTLGIDISGGGARGDWQAGQVLRRGAVRRQVCEYRIKTEIGAFARDMDLLARFYNNAYVCPERNALGEAFLREFLDLYVLARIYRQRERFNVRRQEALKFGYYTGRGRRGKQWIIGHIQNGLRDETLELNSLELLDEMLAYQKVDLADPNEGVGFRSKSKHDDRIMALGMALEMDYTLPAFRSKAQIFVRAATSRRNHKSKITRPIAWNAW